jgi:hypothetical protein
MWRSRGPPSQGFVSCLSPRALTDGAWQGSSTGQPEPQSMRVEIWVLKWLWHQWDMLCLRLKVYCRVWLLQKRFVASACRIIHQSHKVEVRLETSASQPWCSSDILLTSSEGGIQAFSFSDVIRAEIMLGIEGSYWIIEIQLGTQLTAFLRGERSMRNIEADAW